MSAHNTVPQSPDTKITPSVRDYARQHGLPDGEALAAGLAGKAGEFTRRGSHIYLPVCDI